MDWPLPLAVLGTLLCLCNVCTVSAYPIVSQEFQNDTYYWRLVNGNTEYEGRLEVRRNDTDWGYVDGYMFGYYEVMVACDIFGYSHGLSPDTTGNKFGISDDVNMTFNLVYISCSGTEESLLQCYNRGGFGYDLDSYPSFSSPVGITCLPGNTTLQIRIDPVYMAGDLKNGGPLQIYDGVQHWGRICGSAWHKEDADVACKQLGFPHANAITSYPAPDDTDYLLTHVGCSKYEPVSNLADCSYYGIKDADCPCYSDNVAGVLCATDETMPAAANITYRFDRQPEDTFYDSGVLQAKLQGEDEWRTLCFEEQRMDSGAYTVASGMCNNILGEELANHKILGHSQILGTEEDIPMTENSKFALVGEIVTYPFLELKNHIAVNSACSNYGYVALHAICQHTIIRASIPVSLIQTGSCVDRCGYRPDNINCRCDHDCTIRKDCCLDYLDVCISDMSTTHPSDATAMMPSPPSETSAIIPSTSYHCLETSSDILETEVVKMCPEDSRTILYVRYKCTNDPIPTGLTSDILLHWPIFDKFGQNFRNIFCAICNGNHHFDYELWNVNAPIPSFFSNLGGFVPYGKRRRRRQANSCDVDSGGYSSDDETAISVGKKLRFCQSDLVASCPPDYADQSIAQACEDYSTHVCHFDFSFPTYKNPHCMICNDQLDQQRFHICDPAFKFAPSAFFDLSWRFTDAASARPTCSLNNHQIPDMTTGGCQQLDCPAGYRLIEGQCVFQRERTNILDGMHCVRDKNTHLFFAGTDLQTKVETVDCVVQEMLTKAALPTASNSSFEKRHLKWLSGNIEIWSVALTANDYIGEEVILYVAESLSQDSTFAQGLKTKCSVSNVEIVHTCKKYDMIQNCAFNWHKGDAADFTRVNATSAAEVYRFHNNYIIPDFIFSHTTFNYDVNSLTYDTTEHVLVCGYATSPLVSQCQLVTVEKLEYVVIDAGSAIEYNGTRFQAGEFIMLPDGRAQVCEVRTHDAQTTPKPTEDGNKTAYYFMNMSGQTVNQVYFFGTFVSLGGLVTTALGYALLSEIRDYHGRGILSLILSVFVGQILLLLTKNFPVDNSLCMLLSVVSHYAWLSAFNWINVIVSQLAYHFVVLKLSAPDDISSCCEVICTNLAGWGLPVLVIIVSGGLHMMGSDVDINFQYGGKEICWINGAVSDLLAFGAPVGTSVLYCTVMFLITLATLRTARKQATDLRGGIDWADGLCKLYQCGKIGIAMTITWVVCYLAVHINTTGFWWLFVVCNSVLGLVIFINVATDRRTKDAWRNRFGKLQQKTGDSSGKGICIEDKAACAIKQPIKSSASVTTVTAGMSSCGAIDEEDSSKFASEEDTDSAPNLPTPIDDMNAPLKADDKVEEAKEGIANPAAELGDEDAANNI